MSEASHPPVMDAQKGDIIRINRANGESVLVRVTAVKPAADGVITIETEPVGGESFTCPRCHRTSHNANDLREGYCGACHDWTGKPS